jgi:hypothetical protein
MPMIIDFHLAKQNGVFEFQSFLEQDDLGKKLSFDLSLELPWGHFNSFRCLVPLLLPPPTFFGPCDFFIQNRLCFLDGNKN